jgi:CRISPR-associated endonuclease/helicase Cas3
LRRTARKNTAVACHWIHGRNRGEILWIVGDRSRFNSRGAVPTNTTATDILRKKSENTWHNLRLIRLLAGLAALWHDLGKASKAFQDTLKSPGVKRKNLYRHEWVSLRLFQAFVGEAAEDAEWLKRLAALAEQEDKSWLSGLYRDGLDNASKPPSLEAMPPAAKAVGWLVLSHHRLPYPSDKSYLSQESQLKKFWADLDPTWNQHSSAFSNQNEEEFPNGKKVNPKAYWTFPQGLPTVLAAWRKRAAALAEDLRQLLEPQTSAPPVDDPFVMHLARLSLMLGDHYYSSLDDPRQRLAGQPDSRLYANTDPKGARKQKLDEHLLGVEKQGDRVGRSLPRLAEALPALPRIKKLQAWSGESRFQWQNQAVELAGNLRQASARNGAFIINLASTGCGKTLANLKFMNALAGPDPGLRCAFALGLRVLTRQTGAEYRNRLGLGQGNVAILAGGAATQKLYEAGQEPDSGSLSADEHTLMAEDAIVEYEREGAGFQFIQQLLPDNQWDKARNILEAPLLCCTIDHLVPAVEALRGGRQILPMLRLLSGDLVLDELDDYDLKDLPAVTRLVFLAGLLGSRVLISSATIPPALAQGMFMAYRQGRLYFQRNRGERPLENPPICCAWLDEFRAEAEDCSTPREFAAKHDDFAAKRRERLAKAPVRRAAEIWTWPSFKPGQEKTALWGERILEAALVLHERHGETILLNNEKKISFGLVRLANIDHLYQIAQALFRQNAPAGFHIHLCVYHSQFPLLLRADIENRLDRTLKRTDGRQPWDQPEIQARMSQQGAAVGNHLFIVLASPIAELGRDHDYDWAVIEPSSMRSIIQLVGRVWRHRPGKICGEPNIIIFDRNFKSHGQPDSQPAFSQPGFETGSSKLRHHSLTVALREDEYLKIDSRPRLRSQAGPEFDPGRFLADLEHDRLRENLLPSDTPPGARGVPPSFVRAYSCWRRPQALLTGLLQNAQPFRKEARPEVDLCLLPDEEGETYHLIKLFETESGRTDIPSDNLLDDKLKFKCGAGFSPWGETDYLNCLKVLAEALEMENLESCARLYGTVSLPRSDQGWYFHPILGFNVKK